MQLLWVKPLHPDARTGAYCPLIFDELSCNVRCANPTAIYPGPDNGCRHHDKLLVQLHWLSNSSTRTNLHILPTHSYYNVRCRARCVVLTRFPFVILIYLDPFPDPDLHDPNPDSFLFRGRISELAVSAAESCIPGTEIFWRLPSR